MIHLCLLRQRFHIGKADISYCGSNISPDRKVRFHATPSGVALYGDERISTGILKHGKRVVEWHHFKSHNS